jgi:hypothetical protein
MHRGKEEMKVKDKDYYELCDFIFSVGAEERKKILTLLDDMQDPKDRGTIFDHALTKAYEYAESGRNDKLAKEGIACDAYRDGFLDGVAYRMGGFNA